MSKRGSLIDLGLARHVAAKGEPTAPAPIESTKTRHLQIRLNDAGWHELKLLGLAERRPLQGLMVEALNDLLRKYGRGPLVEGPHE